jgi:pimeloyl-ACP methyl ester carboxylesterase
MRKARRPARRISLTAVLVGVVAILSTACQSTAAPAATATISPLARFTRCSGQPGAGATDWLCGSLEVPLDRAKPASGTIPLAIYILQHTDRTAPAEEPVFTIPGGPGVDAYDNGILYSIQTNLLPHHDIVTIDARGSGHSGAIDCPDLQHGPPLVSVDWDAAVSACATMLGSAADRYGAGDVAMDLDSVRNLLGYQRIDLIGESYASVFAQAYATRFPTRLRALIFDSGFTVGAAAPTYSNFFLPGWPMDVAQIAALECLRDSGCKTLDRDPVSTLVRLVQRVRAVPVRGRSATAGTDAPIVVVDEAALATLFTITDPLLILRAAIALQRGDPQPILQLAGAPQGNGPITVFSAGMSQASMCNDIDSPWDRTDPIPVRRQRLASAIAALPAGAFAPFSKSSWTRVFVYRWCVVWPAPARFEPVIPPGSTFPDVPTLILSGDVDNLVPTFFSRPLLSEFPKATFVLVAGSGHVTMVGQAAGCASSIATRFIETLQAGDTSCAATPSPPPAA